MTDAEVPGQALTLTADTVHVWTASLEVADAELACYAHTLDATEHAHAQRFRFERDRRRFIVARGVRRTLLARYARVAPHRLAFGAGQWGKPHLLEPLPARTIRFNASRSGGIALIGVAVGREIGVDVELERDILDWDEIAERFFSVRERRELQAVPAGQKRLAFFTCWTRKEAYIKARGEGLSLPLDQFDVSLTPGSPAALLGCRVGGVELEEAQRWHMPALCAQPGYLAALVVEGSGCRVVNRTWPLAGA
jgi:4'-phosphopantetheinyl transferase